QSNTMFMPYPLNHTALTLSYTLSLHDALPICRTSPRTKVPAGSVAVAGDFSAVYPSDSPGGWQLLGVTDIPMWDLSRPEPAYIRSEEHTSELQSRENLVCRLLLEKKNNTR